VNAGADVVGLRRELGSLAVGSLPDDDGAATFEWFALDPVDVVPDDLWLTKADGAGSDRGGRDR
jgi:hypothetical protein